jgi:ketosteroid isomerase-like protein
VFATERAFAKSMADRDLAAFTEFIAEESIFFNGQEEPSRGKKQVVKEWEPYFKETAAPFSWEPDQVEVLASGTLALSTGPVRDPTGKVFGRFNSIWRLEGPNTWRIVFDKGSPPSPGPR